MLKNFKLRKKNVQKFKTKKKIREKSIKKRLNVSIHSLIVHGYNQKYCSNRKAQSCQKCKMNDPLYDCV
jgi:hypothetical protein